MAKREHAGQPRTAKVECRITPGPKPNNRTVCEQSADGVVNWETTERIYPIHPTRDSRDR